MMNFKRIITLITVLLAMYLVACPALATDCTGKTASGIGTGVEGTFSCDHTITVDPVTHRNKIEICLGESIRFDGTFTRDVDYYNDPNQCDQVGAMFCWSDTAGGSQLKPTAGSPVSYSTSDHYIFTPSSAGTFTVYGRIGDGGHPHVGDTATQDPAHDNNQWPAQLPYWNGNAGPQGSGDDSNEATCEWDITVKDITGVSGPATVALNQNAVFNFQGTFGANPNADITWSGGVTGTGASVTGNWNTAGLKTITATSCGKPKSTHVLVTNLPNPGGTPPTPTNGDGGSAAGSDYCAVCHGTGPGISMRGATYYSNLDGGPGSDGSNCGPNGYMRHVMQAYDNDGESFCYWDRNGQAIPGQPGDAYSMYVKNRFGFTRGSFDDDDDSMMSFDAQQARYASNLGFPPMGATGSKHWNGTITVTEADGTVSVFNCWYDHPVGPSSVTDPAGNTTIYNRDPNTGAITSVVLPTGETWTYTCGPGDTRITRADAPDGSYVTATYIGGTGPDAGKLDVVEGHDSLGQVVNSFDYNYNSLTGQLESCRIGKRTLYYSYGSNPDSITVTEHPGESNPDMTTVYQYGADTTTITRKHDTNSALDETTTYKFYTDGNGNKTYLNQVIDPLGSVTTYDVFQTSDWLDGEIHTITVDPDGPLGSKNGIQTHYVYYNETDPDVWVKPLQRVETTLLDNNNETFTEAEYTYYGDNNDTIWIDTETDVRGNKTHYVRPTGALWKVQEVQVSEQVGTNTVWHTVGDYDYYGSGINGSTHGLPGQLMSSSVPDIDGTTPNSETYQYDDLGGKKRLSPTRTYFQHNGVSTLGFTAYYDDMQYLVKTIDTNTQGPREIDYQYDAVGRNTHTIYHKSPADVQTTNVYSCCDVMLSRDEDGRETYYRYDTAGRVVKVSTSNQGTCVYDGNDANYPNIPPLVTYTYDAFGNVASETTYSDTGVGRTTTYTYDKLNRVVTVEHPSNIIGTENNWYDVYGNLLYSKDSNGDITLYNYDEENRLKNVYFKYPGDPTLPPDSDYMENTPPNEHYGYDGHSDLVTEMTDSTGTSYYSYDYLDRLQRYTPSGHDASDYMIGYSYNNLDEKTSIVIGRPDPADPNYPISFNFDSYSKCQLIDLAYNVNYDYYESGWLKQITSGTQLLASYTDYDPLGNLHTLTYGNENYTTFTYDNDPRYRLSQKLLRKQDNTSLLDINCTLRDAVGNARTLVDNGNSESLTYNSNDRLLTATFPGQNPVTYGNDWVGNRRTPPTTPSIYNNADQLISMPGVHSYAYSGDGSLTQVYDGLGTLTDDYTYHPDGLLNVVRYGNLAKTCTHSWDADGFRRQLQIVGQTYSYVYDIDADIPAVIEESTATGGSVYYYREPDGTLIARQQGQTLQYYHFDQQGSTRLLTDVYGNQTDEYVYDDAWGQSVRHTIGTTQQPYQYGGEYGYYTHYQDPDFKLLQLGVRFYDPETGRFTQTDPLGDGINDYEYAGGNPVSWSDPWGLKKSHKPHSQPKHHKGKHRKGHPGAAAGIFEDDWWLKPIRERMKDLIKSIPKRAKDLREDTRHLKEERPTGKDSYQGHRERLDAEKKELKREWDAAKDENEDLEDEVGDCLDTPTPTKPDRYKNCELVRHAGKAVVVTTTAGAGAWAITSSLSDFWEALKAAAEAAAGAAEALGY